jgi:2-iminobutanoate/2-iminopropanoate deaminase
MIKKVELHDVEEWTYSDYVVAGDYLYTSHIGGFVDQDGNSLKAIEAQTRRSLDNLKETLKEEGLTLEDVIKTTVYLKDLEDFKGMRDVYRDYFTDDYPVRMTATTEFLDPECIIQIVAVAYKPQN